MFEGLKRRARERVLAETLLDKARTASRTPALFGPGRIPDTLDGRFESLVLHVVLMLEGLRGRGGEAAAISQAVFDALFRDLDGALREIGVGDLSVGKKVRKMGEAFYGRAAAYRDAFAGEDEALADALARNLFATTEPEPAFLAAITDYVRASHEGLADQPLKALIEGELPRWGVLRA
jgi:cytochrome b pre-mRNA-processing protein 3